MTAGLPWPFLHQRLQLQKPSPKHHESPNRLQHQINRRNSRRSHCKNHHSNIRPPIASTFTKGVARAIAIFFCSDPLPERTKEQSHEPSQNQTSDPWQELSRENLQEPLQVLTADPSQKHHQKADAIFPQNSYFLIHCRDRGKKHHKSLRRFQHPIHLRNPRRSHRKNHLRYLLPSHRKSRRKRNRLF